MKTIPEWPEAQRLEKNLWDGVVRDEHYTLAVLTANAAKASKLRNCVARMPETAPQNSIAHASHLNGYARDSTWLGIK